MTWNRSVISMGNWKRADSKWMVQWHIWEAGGDGTASSLDCGGGQRSVYICQNPQTTTKEK